jgi:hypothetical protein
MAKRKRTKGPTRAKSASRLKSVAKKPAQTKTVKPKKTPKPRAPRLRPIDLAVQQRLSQLDLSPTFAAEQSSEILFDLERQPLKPAERLLLFEQAKAAMEAAILRFDDPAEWLRAGRAAAYLPPRDEPR